MADGGLTFDEDRHEYRCDGRLIPSVTGLLRRYGVTSVPNVPEPVLEVARQRGNAVHRAIHLEQRGELDWSTLDPTTEPQIFAWNAWKEAVGYVSHGGEEPLVDRMRGYAGTPDDYGMCTRGRYAGRTPVVDRKCTAVVLPEVGVQLAAYRMLLTTIDVKATHRLAVQLKPDGTFKEHEFRDPHDLAEFWACLTLHHRAMERAKKGIIE